jgi:hypothetical protein
MNDRVYKKVSILKLEASWSVLFLQPHCPIGPLLELTHFRSWKSWENLGVWVSQVHQKQFVHFIVPIGSMYAIYGNIYHQYTPNVSIYTIHGSYGVWSHSSWSCFRFPSFRHTMSLTPAPQRLRRTTLPFWCFSHLATVDILTNGRTHGWSCFPQSMKETILTCPPMSFRFHDWPFKPPFSVVPSGNVTMWRKLDCASISLNGTWDDGDIRRGCGGSVGLQQKLDGSIYSYMNWKIDG